MGGRRALQLERCHSRGPDRRQPRRRDVRRPNRRIVFEHFSSKSASQITTVTPRGRHARVLTNYRHGADAPDVSPRGGRIAFTVLRSPPNIPYRVLTMRTGGANVRNRSHGCSGQCLGDGEPAWSPDGRQIVFNRAFGPIVDDNADHVDLMIMNRNGTHVRTLLHSPDYGKRRLEAGRWSWSPDGTQLAGTFQDLNSPRQASAIFTVELDSLDIHRITPWRLDAGNPDHPPTAGGSSSTPPGRGRPTPACRQRLP